MADLEALVLDFLVMPDPDRATQVRDAVFANLPAGWEVGSATVGHGRVCLTVAAPDADGWGLRDVARLLRDVNAAYRATGDLTTRLLLHSVEVLT